MKCLLRFALQWSGLCLPLPERALLPRRALLPELCTVPLPTLDRHVRSHTLSRPLRFALHSSGPGSAPLPDSDVPSRLRLTRSALCSVLCDLCSVVCALDASGAFAGSGSLRCNR